MELLKLFDLILVTFYLSTVSTSIQEQKCLRMSEQQSIICLPLKINYNDTNSTILCRKCQLENLPYHLIECKTTEDITVNIILKSVPNNTQGLVINVENIWNTFLGTEPEPIDMTPIVLLRKLRCFILLPRHKYHYQMYPLKFNANSFKHLQNLSILSITLPITENKNKADARLSNIIGDLRGIKCLDLSNTRGLGARNIFTIVKNTNIGLNYLYLRGVQYTGVQGYDCKLNITDMLGGRQFPKLKEIDISGNGICKITPGITRAAPSLQNLDVSENFLIESHVIGFGIEVLIHTTLTYVNFSYQGYEVSSGSSSGEINNWKPNSSKISPGSGNLLIETKSNNQKVLNKGIFYDKLLHLKVKCVNKYTKGNISRIIDNKRITCKLLTCLFPLFFGDYQCDNFPVVPSINKVWNITCMMDFKFPLGKKLTTVDLSYISLETAETASSFYQGKFCLGGNNLSNIYIGGNKKLTKVTHFQSMVNTKGFIGFDKLTHLSLKDSNIHAHITSSNHKNKIFPNLKYLDISGNYITFNKSFELCRYTPNLEYLYMRNINLTDIPKNCIKNCTKLKKFYIGDNYVDLASLNLLNFSGVKQLQFLELKNISLSVLEKGFIKSLQYKRNLTIDLSNNHLSCNCSKEAQAFTEWMHGYSHNLYGYNNLYCYGPGGLNFVYNIPHDKKFWDNCNSHLRYMRSITIIKVTTSIIVTILIIVLAICLYKWRWRLKYMLFQVQQMMQFYFHFCKTDDEYENEVPKIWKYDAFISYCAADRFWVHDTLMKTLEDVYGFHLCIHYRDFPVGGAIAETICECMTQSREIIIVLSDIALQSEWCHFELDAAFIQIQKRRKQVIVIKLGQIRMHALDTRVAHILDSHTYLEWSNNYKSHTLFWATLVGKMYNDPKGRCICCCAYGTRSLGYQHLVEPQYYNATQYDDFSISFEENVSNLPEHLQDAFRQLKDKRSKALVLRENLQNAMESEDVPIWAYGPTPSPIEELLKEKKNVLDEQVSKYARQRISLMINCLDQCQETETKKYNDLMEEVQTLQEQWTM